MPKLHPNLVLSRKRNALKGSLHFILGSINNIDSNIISLEDHLELLKLTKPIVTILKSWDPHYIKKRYSK